MSSQAGDGWSTRAVIRVVIGFMILPLLGYGFFHLARDFHWFGAWLAIILLIVGMSASGIWVHFKDPELLRRRSEVGAGTPIWDQVILSIFGLVYLAIWVVGALDHRAGWSAMPSWSMAVGITLFVVFIVGLTWSMTINTHFEKTVRIQSDRGHRVIDDGPYRWIRHPGYAFTIVGMVFSLPLLLSSLWSLIPALLTALVLAIRTALEDRFLQRGLEGYKDYAARVRYRLIPGVW